MPVDDRGETNKKVPTDSRDFTMVIVKDQSLLSGNGFVSPFPIKTIQVLAITSLMAELAFIHDLYGMFLIMIINDLIEMQNNIMILKQQKQLLG